MTVYAILPIYGKPRPRDSLSVGANHFREQCSVPNKLAKCMSLSNPVWICVCVLLAIESSCDCVND